jgi:hypothetical protein
MPTVTRQRPFRLDALDPSVLADTHSAWYGHFVFAQLLVAAIILT